MKTDNGDQVSTVKILRWYEQFEASPLLNVQSPTNQVSVLDS